MKNGDPFDRRRLKAVKKEWGNLTIEEKTRVLEDHKKQELEKADKWFLFLVKHKKKIALLIVASYAILILVMSLLGIKDLVIFLCIAVFLHLAGLQVDYSSQLPSRRHKHDRLRVGVFNGTSVMFFVTLITITWYLFLFYL